MWKRQITIEVSVCNIFPLNAGFSSKSGFPKCGKIIHSLYGIIVGI
jgi:hypothetical protein